MDKIKAFFETMTVWNWIALVAFLIALVSGLNALLNLRSRWKGWRAVKTKAKFEKRLAEFKEQIAIVGIFRESKQDFLILGFDILFSYLVKISIAVIVALAGLLFVFSSFPQAIKPIFSAIAFGVAFNVVISALGGLHLSSQLFANVSRPQVFTQRVQEFIKEGKSNGFMASDDSTIEELLKTHKLLK